MKTDFEKCAEWLLSSHREGWIVCHGIVMGKHREDVFSHCWIEYPEDNRALVLTETKALLCDAGAYREAMNAYTIDEFSADQLQARFNRTKSFGPYNVDLMQVPLRVLH